MTPSAPSETSWISEPGGGSHWRRPFCGYAEPKGPAPGHQRCAGRRGGRCQESDKDDLWSDVSEEEIYQTTVGKAEGCINNGVVEGDINAGGVAGAMAVESMLDPEEDIERVGDDSFSFHYETRAILLNCENRVPVTSKKDYAGGIVGRMDLGYILDCRNYGNVESTDGSYVGGIAGSSASTIRRSQSKCMTSGKNFVGGGLPGMATI